ncbi:unnamed protein product [Cyprideis torosa]|uniref:Uncharacterized protein n=1 Tax=Cyprideis torosa TaxID=163714 RepID=A0A7R8W215_9CRUS|nr:unnamed protein product [Cyprideis torosa]CAG0880506.1 unnamed protein product [Cyprideis torosa]
MLEDPEKKRRHLRHFERGKSHSSGSREASVSDVKDKLAELRGRIGLCIRRLHRGNVSTFPLLNAFLIDKQLDFSDDLKESIAAHLEKITSEFDAYFEGVVEPFGAVVDDDPRRLRSTVPLWSRRNPTQSIWSGSPRFRAREERKLVLRLTISKLRSIEDPESILRRSVLLNNTYKSLQNRNSIMSAFEEGFPAATTCFFSSYEQQLDEAEVCIVTSPSEDDVEMEATSSQQNELMTLEQDSPSRGFSLTLEPTTPPVAISEQEVTTTSDLTDTNINPADLDAHSTYLPEFANQVRPVSPPPTREVEVVSSDPIFSEEASLGPRSSSNAMSSSSVRPSSSCGISCCENLLQKVVFHSLITSLES